MLFFILEKRFTLIPPKLRKLISQITDEGRIQKLADAALDISSIREFAKIVEKNRQQ